MSIQEQFNRISKKYDSQRKELIPCFDDFYGIAVDNLEVDTSIPKILDLGAGTGLMSQKVLEKYPDARLTLVDISDAMLDVARQRFEHIPGVSFRHEDLTHLSLSEEYDAVVSSLAIHHLPDNDKKDLYGKIYKGLKPEGIFVNAEQVLADNAFLQDRYESRWQQVVERSSLSREEIRAAYERVKLDKRTPLDIQMDWLKKSGFRYVDCLYKYYDFAVIWAKK
ncbi:MAG: methyltransferase domain-containing protein [Bacteroidales bacterium]|jgi:tRNA (cmo5U34)-methyltransferase|nr:methyltransferase domain-containing protein [Bacteroidales bacterium]